jgi:hypothetical protein
MSNKFPSPLLGYNNNVRHKGKVFHIQTEDSGVKYGHIITHLFMDGGRILKSVKTSYSEYIGNERMGDIVREMMKQQHKAMFIALRDGKFDAMGEDLADASPSSQTVSARDTGARAPLRSSEPPSGSGRTGRDEPEELLLDIDVLRATETEPLTETPSELPPPPAHLLSGKKGPPSPGTAAAASDGRAEPSSPAAASQSERRYAPTRPASIFAQARPLRGKSIFGEDLMGDKSLDEVILSYLADDLDTKKK